jgi:hypothetical protein
LIFASVAGSGWAGGGAGAGGGGGGAQLASDKQYKADPASSTARKVLIINPG